MSPITLPYPVSVNGAFRKHNGAHLSEAYRNWRDEAGWMLKQQKPAKVSGPVVILIEAKAPDRRRRDIDNISGKAICDLLVRHGVIEDDDSRYVREVTARWIEDGEPRAVVTVRAAE